MNVTKPRLKQPEFILSLTYISADADLSWGYSNIKHHHDQDS